MNSPKKKQYQKIYRENNKDYYVKYREEKKEYFKQYNKQYKNQNRDLLNDKFKLKIICECGCELTKYKIKRHLLTKKHLKIMESKTSNEL